jgi:hypothetical protein
VFTLRGSWRSHSTDLRVHDPPKSALEVSSDPARVEGGQLLAMFVDPEIGRGPGDGDDADDDGEDDS